MQPPSRRLFFFCWIICVQAIALYLFTTGFFLTRFEVSELSSCSVLPHEDGQKSNLRTRSLDELATKKDKNGCWMDKKFDKIVFIVIDALRYDFAIKSDAKHAREAPFYLNHLPILAKKIEEEPTKSMLFKFVADPPTMTMQRLKGLTTGSLPTFLDIKDNMHSSEIMEDNIIKQMHQQQKNIVFMGDDTWDSLYPSYFHRKFSFDSFIVKDLDTVDNGVIKNLFPELKKKDWNLLIGHFLGVDHVGHTHGPSTPFMTNKLRQMNDVLTRLMNAIEEDTLLVVLGDHGMSAGGNHGGASDEETGAALFLHSKKHHLHLVDTANMSKSVLLDELNQIEIPQVNLVPTLSLLAGLPIPFGSLGAIIPQLFFLPELTNNDDFSSSKKEKMVYDSYKSLNKALHLNMHQVRRYLVTYSKTSKIPTETYKALDVRYQHILEIQKVIEDLPNNAPIDSRITKEKLLAEKQLEYIREAFTLGRSMWTQFDLKKMAFGICLLLLTTLLIALNLCLVNPPTQVHWTSMIAGFVMGISGLVDIFARGVLPDDSISKGLCLGAFAGLVPTLFSSFLSMKRSEFVVSLFTQETNLLSIVVAFVTVLLHLLGLLSNSYIVAEDKVLQFLSMTIGFFLLHQSFTRACPMYKPLSFVCAFIFVFCSKLSSVIQPPNIIHTEASIIKTWLPVMLLVMICFFLLKIGTSNTKTPNSRKDLLCLSVICSTGCVLYWFFSPITDVMCRLWLPRSAYLSLLVGFLLHGLSRSGLSSRLKSTLIDHTTVSFDANFFYLLIFLLPTYLLVIGPSGPLSVVFVLGQAMSFSFVAFACNNKKTPTTWFFLWATVCYHSYFITGHQNTFTSLQNAAGFIGFDEFYFSFAGILLGLNTFGNYAICLSTLPLVAFHFQRQHRWIDACQDWWRCAYSVILYFSLNCCVSTIFVGIERHHLMAWAIFAPKFIFDGITLLLVQMLVGLFSYIVLRNFTLE